MRLKRWRLGSMCSLMAQNCMGCCNPVVIILSLGVDNVFIWIASLQWKYFSPRIPAAMQPKIVTDMAIRRFRSFLAVAVSLAAVSCAWADPAPFDLTGPKLEVRVTRAGKTLPISEVPNLAAGDQVWIKADLPKGQAAHYLMVAAFLRGSTNPPPENWFFSRRHGTRRRMRA